MSHAYGGPAVGSSQQSVHAPVWSGDPAGNGQRPAAPPRSGAAPRRPAVVVAAAVLGFEAAGLLLFAVLAWDVLLSVLGSTDDGSDQAWSLVCLFAVCAVAATLLIGGVQLIRGRGRRLLLVATGLELAAFLALTVVAFVRLPDADEIGAGLPGVAGDVIRLVLGALLAGGLIVLAVLVLRLCLVGAPSVGRWLQEERVARRAPRWSPDQDRWVPTAPRLTRGTLLGVLVPVGALAVVSALLLAFSPTVSPEAFGTAAGEGGAYRGDSEWGRSSYQGGRPLSPPVVGDPLYVGAADQDAQDCATGRMAACDDLFFTSPVDDVYEWYGSSCAGRLDHESDGGCVAELGAAAD